MHTLVWKHSRTRIDATAAIQDALKQSGHDQYVKWTGHSAEASVGPFGMLIYVKGEVSDDAVVIEKCSGLGSQKCLDASAELLERLFPGGRVSAHGGKEP